MYIITTTNNKLEYFKKEEKLPQIYCYRQL